VRENAEMLAGQGTDNTGLSVGNMQHGRGIQGNDCKNNRAFPPSQSYRGAPEPVPQTRG
jgi:hypothetical protein